MKIPIILKGKKDCDLLALCLYYKSKAGATFRELIVSYVRNTPLSINIPYSQICFDDNFVLNALREKKFNISINENEYSDVCLYLSNIKKGYMSTYIRNIIRHYMFPNIDFMYLNDPRLSRPHDLSVPVQMAMPNYTSGNPYLTPSSMYSDPYPMNVAHQASPMTPHKVTKRASQDTGSAKITNSPISQPKAVPTKPAHIADIEPVKTEAEQTLNHVPHPVVEVHEKKHEANPNNSPETIKVDTKTADINNGEINSDIAHTDSLEENEELDTAAFAADFGNLFAMVQNQYSH